MSLTKFRTLVTTNWLRDQLFAASGSSKPAPLRILDASASRDASVDGYTEYYKGSHIPEASYFSLHGLCPASPSSYHKYPVPDTNRFQDYAESLGICNNTHVIAYDRSDTIFALKTWWLFRLFGHKNVSVLDGGFRKWLMDGFEVSAEEPVVQHSSFQVAFNPKLVHNFEDMVDNLKTKDKQMIDSRGRAAFYNNKDKMREGQVGGHMPGAKNIPYPSLFEEDGTFKSRAELKAAFDAAGVDLGLPVVATCQTALTACGLVAAAHMLGKEVVPVYNGSFQEWSQRAEPDQIEVD